MWSVLVSVASAAPEATVTVPLSAWEALAERPTAAPQSPGALPLARRLEGTLSQGLLTGVVTARFEVTGPGPLPWPVVGASTTVTAATLDGRPVSLSADADGRFWTVSADPGVHDVTVSVLHGQEIARFERALVLSFPPGGSTAFDVVLPEADILPTVQHGVWVSRTRAASGTRLVGWADASGRLDVTWERTGDVALDPSDATLDADVYGVLTLSEGLVRGTTRVSVRVREGAVDRLQLRAPEAVEVLSVTGPQVLQWHSVSDPKNPGTDALEILLRQVEDQHVEATVLFQYPVQRDAPVPLHSPLPRGATVSGALGLVASPGLQVDTEPLTDALDPQDVPRPVLDLTRDPLRTAIRLTDQPPSGTVRISRQPDVSVSTSRIDDLQAIVVAMEDGTEIGKARLVVRNTSRQLLTVDLPPGARLTHCFRDGTPLSPGAADRPERVLVPLTRSERNGGQSHVVVPGDTLSGLALRYFGDASLWPTLDAANHGQLAGGLTVGQQVAIPQRGQHEEQAFTLELGWERRGEPFGAAGVRRIQLPSVDLDVMAANWHLYLPDTMNRLSVRGSGALTAVDEARPGPARRLLDLLVHDGLPLGTAYAGEGYASVLSTRRSSYLDKKASDLPMGSDPFPLVGDRNRLQGVLLGTTPATAQVVWISRDVVPVVQWLALALVAVGAAIVVLGARSWVRVGVGLACLVGTLSVGHFVLGVHRSAVLGADLGLAVALGWRAWHGAVRFAVPFDRTRAIALSLAGLVVSCGLLAWPSLWPVGLGVALAFSLTRTSP